MGSAENDRRNLGYAAGTTASVLFGGAIGVIADVPKGLEPLVSEASYGVPIGMVAALAFHYWVKQVRRAYRAPRADLEPREPSWLKHVRRAYRARRADIQPREPGIDELEPKIDAVEQAFDAIRVAIVDEIKQPDGDLENERGAAAGHGNG